MAQSLPIKSGYYLTAEEKRQNAFDGNNFKKKVIKNTTLLLSKVWLFDGGQRLDVSEGLNGWPSNSLLQL